MKSALILEDGHLMLEEIIKLNLPNAEVAFLSTFQTTTGDERLLEEAVHIADVRLLTGYCGVVATMWSIQDELAPEVADEFMHVLCKIIGDQIVAKQPKHCTFPSKSSIRRENFTAWIPFVHRGI